MCIRDSYKVDAERHIVVDEREAAVVREAFKLHIAGGQIRDIVKLFADRGVMGRRGKPVSNAVVYRMLRNEKYLGEFYIQDVKLNVEPIIDQATFLEAARHFKTSRNNAAGRAKVNYLPVSYTHLYRPELCIFDPIQSFVPAEIKMGDRNACLLYTSSCV